MRSVDLAIYADTLAGEHAALAARLEQARARLREAAIEREARASLDAPDIVQLESLGILGAIDERTARGEGAPADEGARRARPAAGMGRASPRGRARTGRGGQRGVSATRSPPSAS